MRRRRLIGLLTVAALVGTVPVAQAEPPFTEPHRPQFHFTPAKNWMNDPNGLVYHGGMGQVVITSLVFPDAAGDEVKVFSEGGSARIDRLTLWHMGSYRR
ncbi:GH32 C-terminal domain-containing protein [Lentzea californiensis]|uniref:GH32 C-terminal domain-containing protein n=1 Tax=Lentzea californiensis TaxID=438851 RepID=UPI0021651EAA|nr:GH32 C-terminal domain-containing protein [Lentzea californiensis]MCR3754522.1 Glycosyl hydrolases family 32 N-terminal domain-containing protein [Lentzea californiensis]